MQMTKKHLRTGRIRVWRVGRGLARVAVGLRLREDVGEKDEA